VIATATFPGGRTATDRIRVTVENHPPRVQITSPRGSGGTTPTFSRSEPITFRATSVDPDVGQLRDDQVSWHLDDAAASFAAGHSATVALGAAPGLHTVTFRGCDGFGLCAADTVTIAIREDPANLPPAVRITNPAHGAFLQSNGSDAAGPFHELTLQAVASDPEGGPVTLVWTDSMNGGPPIQIGTGPSPTVRLRGACESAGHRITLTATDNAGNSRQDAVVVSVTTIC
jgi:serine protease